MFIFGGHDIKEGSLDSLWMVELTKLSDFEKINNSDYNFDN